MHIIGAQIITRIRVYPREIIIIKIVGNYLTRIRVNRPPQASNEFPLPTNTRVGAYFRNIIKNSRAYPHPIRGNTATTYTRDKVAGRNYYYRTTNANNFYNRITGT